MKRIILLLSILNFQFSMLSAQSDILVNFAGGTGVKDAEGPQMVCDGNIGTKWCIDEREQMPYFIILDAGAATTVKEYGLTTADDTHMYPSRNPITWKMSGSNDKQTWTLLDEQRNNRLLPAEDFQEYRFKPASEGQYRYYRFEFIRMAGGTRIQLSEIKLYRSIQMPIKTTFVSGPGRATPRVDESAAMVTDGRLFTKWCIDEPAQMPYTVVLDAGASTAISEYRFYTGDDTHTYPQRNPVAWRVSGSNDKQNWTPLDEKKANYSLRDENEQEYRFKPAASGDFRYYRFEFIRMADGTRIQLSEIKLFK